MTISLLASCNNGEVNPPSAKEYTVTILESQHFRSKQPTFTFREDHFTPIVAVYEIDESYAVVNIESNIGSTICDFDIEEHTITITPQENKNITINAEVVKMSFVSTIKIIVDKASEQFISPDKKAVNFKYNDYKEIHVPYTITQYYAASPVVSDPECGDCECINNELVITPKANEDFSITITVNKKTKTITFNPEEGEIIKGEGTQTIECGTVWGEVAPTVIAKRANYKFSGWSFDAKKPEDRVVIPNDYVIDDSTKNMVFPIYDYDIQLAEGSALKIVKVKENRLNVTTDVYVIISDTSKYLMPMDEQSFTVKNKAGNNLSFTYERTSSVQGVIRILHKELQQDGDAQITVNNYQPEYQVDTSSITPGEDHLIYMANFPPRRGEDFTFILEAINQSSTNDTYYYYAPDQCEQINISVKTGETYHRLGVSAYKIEFAAEDTYHLRGTVTVFGKYVKGDLKIDATARSVNGYFYELNGYGITFNSQSDYMRGVQLSDEDLHIRITGEKFQWVTDENIAIRTRTNDGATTWYTLEQFNAAYPNTIKYSQATEEFMFTNFQGNNISSVFVHVFDPEYSVFANASWAQLAELTSLPDEYINDWFKVGETREIQFNNLAHTLRIIGINHDNLSNGEGKAGLTVEFADVMTNTDGNPLKTFWDEDWNTNFPGSILNNLVNSIIGQLPIDLQSVMKEVSKQVSLGDNWDPNNYLSTRLFPLSCHEMSQDSVKDTREEGVTYEYYTTNPQSRRVKTTASGALCTAYWTRSPRTYEDAHRFSKFVNGSGEFEYELVYTDYAFAPAFCI